MPGTSGVNYASANGFNFRSSGRGNYSTSFGEQGLGSQSVCAPINDKRTASRGRDDLATSYQDQTFDFSGQENIRTQLTAPNGNYGRISSSFKQGMASNQLENVQTQGASKGNILKQSGPKIFYVVKK